MASFENDESYAALTEVYRSFHFGERLVTINAPLKLNKTQRALCEALLLNDVDLKEDVMNWLAKRSSLSDVLQRYHCFDQRLQLSGLPTHFAARIVNGLGAISSGQNILLNFPDCLGVVARNTEDHFSVELIDVWNNIFQRAVFPCARNILESGSQVELISGLATNLDKTVFLAALFHEVGHFTGAWRISPSPDAQLKVSRFYLDVFSQLSADLQLIRYLFEFPEVASLIVLQRLFWFGRRGFRDNPTAAKINVDIDSWISALLWNRLTRAQVVCPTQNGRWSFHRQRLSAVVQQLSIEIEELGTRARALEPANVQDQLVLSWMKEEVDWSPGAGFLLPRTLREVYAHCTSIPESPHFHPMTESMELMGGDFVL